MWRSLPPPCTFNPYPHLVLQVLSNDSTEDFTSANAQICTSFHTKPSCLNHREMFRATYGGLALCAFERHSSFDLASIGIYSHQHALNGKMTEL